MMKKIVVPILSVFALVLLVGTAFAANHETLFGNASYVSPGYNSERAVELVSDSEETDAYGGVNYEVPEGTTFADLSALSTYYYANAGDSCGGGSPRFAIGLDSNNDDTTDGYIFAYVGDEPNYTCDDETWLFSGDLLESSKTVDTGQFGGTFYDPYDNAVTNYGSYDVTELFIVVDSSWSAAATGGDGVQTILVDDTTIADVLYTYEEELTNEERKEMCKKGGWQTMTTDDGGTFRNQGQCVSYFASDGKSVNNPGRGN